MIVNRCMEAHPLPRGPRWDPSILTLASSTSHSCSPPGPWQNRPCPHATCPRRGLPCLAPAQWAEVNGRRLRGANHGGSLPNLHANHHPEEAARSSDGHRCCCRSLMPDFAANQPAILARLPLRETCLTGSSLAMDLPKIHGTRTMAPPPAARGGSPCPVSACPAPTCHAHHN